jgi:hypothetical protein
MQQQSARLLIAGNAQPSSLLCHSARTMSTAFSAALRLDPSGAITSLFAYVVATLLKRPIPSLVIDYCGCIPRNPGAWVRSRIEAPGQSCGLALPGLLFAMAASFYVGLDSLSLRRNASRSAFAINVRPPALTRGSLPCDSQADTVQWETLSSSAASLVVNRSPTSICSFLLWDARCNKQPQRAQ